MAYLTDDRCAFYHAGVFTHTAKSEPFLPFLFLPVMILAALKSPRQLAVAWLSTLVVCYTVLLNL
ncbi:MULTISPECIES: hypothetical protein [unclassified Pseudoalteromonas]|uniref:hypothetical protein n=1 Tax=unclassified Pseudoalteromonas TaxID=194690 RepID=UPI003015701C